jgi:hypothetical protein
MIFIVSAGLRAAVDPEQFMKIVALIDEFRVNVVTLPAR